MILLKPQPGAMGTGGGRAAGDGPRRSQRCRWGHIDPKADYSFERSASTSDSHTPKGQKELLLKTLLKTLLLGIHHDVLLLWLPIGLELLGPGLRILPLHPAPVGPACLMNESTDGWKQGKEKRKKGEWEGKGEV